MELKKGQKVKIKESWARNLGEEIIENKGTIKEVYSDFVVLKAKIKYHYNNGIIMDSDLYIEPKHIELL